MHVSGAVGPLIPNPNPAIAHCHKKRLFGTVICTCKRNCYEVCFDNGTLLECASSLLRIEAADPSLPPDVVEASISRGDEATLESPYAHDIQDSEPLEEEVIEEGENKPEGDVGVADDNLAEAKVEDNPVGEHPVCNLELAEPETTYEGRKQAALRQIAALAGEQVTVQKSQNEEVVWTAIPESHPDDVRSNAVNDGCRLKNINSIMRKNKQ